jgi:hypothetical protein
MLLRLIHRMLGGITNHLTKIDATSAIAEKILML